MKNKTKVVISSAPVTGLLGVAFVVLKLCGVINWSWWWVTAPFWAVPAIFFSIAAVLGVVYLALLAFTRVTR